MGRRLELPLTNTTSIVLEKIGNGRHDDDHSSVGLERFPEFLESCLWDVSVAVDNCARNLGSATLGECRAGLLKLVPADSRLKFQHSQTAGVDAAFVMATYGINGPMHSIYAIAQEDDIELAWQDSMGVLHRNGLVIDQEFVAQWVSLFGTLH